MSAPPSGASVFVSSVVLEGSKDVKFPSIDAHADRVFVAGTAAESATLWTTSTAALAFDQGTPFGQARGQPDYASTVVHATSDGALVAGWIDQIDDKGRPCTFHVRMRPPSGDWGPDRVVLSDLTFRPYLDVALASPGLFVVWDQDSRIWFSRSTDQGMSFSLPVKAIDEPPGSKPDIAVTASGLPVFAHAYGSAQAGLWNGTEFTRESFANVAPNDFYADAAIATAGDGRVYAAFRGVESGVFLASRAEAGTWTVEKAFEDEAQGHVDVAVDAWGGVHLAWACGSCAQPGVHHAWRPPAGTWSSAAVAGIQNFHNGAWMALTSQGVLRAWIATEDFEETEMHTRVCLFEMPQ